MADNPSTVDITVPDIGDVENVSIIEILVNVGDHVAVDDSILTLESDKASMEIPAVNAGTVQSISVAVGASVNVGDVIGTMQIDASQTDATADTRAQNVPAVEQATAPAPAALAPSPQPTTVTPAAAETPSADSSVRQSANSPTAHLENDKQSLPHASPGVRRYAREHGADLRLLTGTGPKGRILRTDVTSFIKGAMEGSQTGHSGSGQSHSGIPALPEIDFSKFG